MHYPGPGQSESGVCNIYRVTSTAKYPLKRHHGDTVIQGVLPETRDCFHTTSGYLNYSLTSRDLNKRVVPA